MQQLKCLLRFTQFFNRGKTMKLGCLMLIVATGLQAGIDPEKICASVEKEMEQLKVPGVQLAIVQDQEVVFQRAWGVRDVEKGLKVTPHTVFPVGSLTKPFTAFLTGQLIDEGRFTWDTRVIDLLPHFRMQDVYATEMATVRDLLTHRIGLPRHDALWFNANMTRSQLLSRLRYIPAISPFRDQFHYQNITFMVCGHISEVLLQTEWEKLLREKILLPLNMKNSTALLADFMKKEDKATGYREEEGKLVATPYIDVSSIAPAAALNTSVHDLIQWMKLLNREGEGLIDSATFREITSPQIVSHSIGAEFGLQDLIHMEAYGLGWMILSYRGELLLFHGGNVEGFSSVLLYLPRRKLCISMLTNKNMTPLAYIVSTSILDSIAGLPPIDWLARFKQDFSTDLLQQDLGKIDVEKIDGAPPSRLLDQYCGVFQNPAYGSLEVKCVQKRLDVHFNNMVFPLDHYHYNVFAISKDCFLPHIRGMKFAFRENIRGEIAGVDIPFEPKIEPIRFEKECSPPLLQAEYLDRFVGKYSYLGFGFTLERKGLTLIAKTSGIDPYILIPEETLRFKIKNNPGKTIRFCTDDKGGVISIQLVTESGVYTAYRSASH